MLTCFGDKHSMLLIRRTSSTARNPPMKRGSIGRIEWLTGYRRIPQPIVRTRPSSISNVVIVVLGRARRVGTGKIPIDAQVSTRVSTRKLVAICRRVPFWGLLWARTRTLVEIFKAGIKIGANKEGVGKAHGQKGGRKKRETSEKGLPW